MADSSKQEQWQKLFGYMLGYQATWVIDVGLKAGLFAAIAEGGPISEEALSIKLGGLRPALLAGLVPRRLCLRAGGLG